MNPYTLVKINFLILALLFVVFLMFQIRSGSLESGLKSLFGAPQTTSSPASR
ncbi:MAG: hypothetical protein KDD34_06210 [Bdellovibrionales bacterium]|nr:hypothetical protein [Bdellovibrionales bacterium]